MKIASHFLFFTFFIFLLHLVTCIANKFSENPLVLGIDLGNENSVICMVNSAGVDVITNEISARQTPSALFFGEDRRYFGEHSTLRACSRPDFFVSKFRELVSRGATTRVELHGKQIILQPFQVLSMYLGHLQRIACREKQGRVSSCVVSVPSYFGLAERQAVIDAGKLQDLVITEVINDGTALALAYGLFRQEAQEKLNITTKILFVDFGHSSTQATLCEFSGLGVKILAHQHCFEVSGAFLEKLLFNHFCKAFPNINFKQNKKAAWRLRSACTNLKKTLSANNEATATLECIDGDTDIHCHLKRSEFEQMIEASGIKEAIKRLCHKSVLSSHSSIGDVAAVEVVGGCSFVPLFSRALEEALEGLCIEHQETAGSPSSVRCASSGNKTPIVRRGLNAGEAVATGCALRAAMTSSLLRVKKYSLSDTLGAGQMVSINWGGLNCKSGGFIDVIPGESCIPFEKKISVPVTSLDFELRVTASVSSSSKTQPEDVMDWSVHLAPDAKKVLTVPPNCTALVKAKIGFTSSGPHVLSPHLEIKQLVQLEEGKEPLNHTGNATGLDAASQKKQPLVTRSLQLKTLRTLARTEKELALAKALENNFDDSDRAVIECMEAHNMLEKFVYEQRENFGEYGELGGYVNPKESKDFLKNLDETEEWLYTKSQQPTSVYQKRLAKLSETVTRAEVAKEKRRTIAVTIESSMQLLQAQLQKIRPTGTENQEHTEAENSLQQLISWLEGLKQALEKTPLYEQVPVETQQIQLKVTKILEECSQLLDQDSQKLK